MISWRGTHLSPALVLVNTLFGIVSLGYCRQLAAFYARRITAGRGAIGLLMTIHLAITVLCFYVLFFAPALGVLRQQPVEPIGLAGYLIGAASPAVFFYCLRQAFALAGAGRRIREAAKAK